MQIVDPRDVPGRDQLRRLIAKFADEGLLIEAGALAFRALLTLIPALLFTIGLLGIFGFDEVWRQDIAPDLRESLSTTSFKFIDEAVTKVLTQKQVFWVTIGAGLAVWESSSIVRAAGELLNRIYEVDDDRSFHEKLLISIPLGALGIVVVLAAAAVVRLGPLLVDDLVGTGVVVEVIGFIVRWLIAGALMTGLLAALLRFTPDIERAPHGLGFGAISIVVAWALATLAFGIYLTVFASYASIFGNLATLFILIEYLFGVSVIFLGGAVLDSMLRERES